MNAFVIGDQVLAGAHCWLVLDAFIESVFVCLVVDIYIFLLIPFFFKEEALLHVHLPSLWFVDVLYLAT